MRRHDIDTIRSSALMLLIIYHASCSFMRWGNSIGFITNKEFLNIYAPMGFMNIWRIPILFVVSGMAFRFAYERRTIKELLKDRFVRIIIPYVFGIFTLGSIPIGIYTYYTEGQFIWFPNPSHLWFLNNIWVYSLATIIVLKIFSYFSIEIPNILARLLHYRLGICAFVLPFVIEAHIFRYNIYSLYVFSLHGWILGLICFATGYIWICNRKLFFASVNNNAFIFLSIATIMYANRLQNEWVITNTVTSIESFCWIVGIFGIAAKYLNKDSNWLKYVKEAVFPVYIFHLPIQQAVAYFLFPLPIDAIYKLLLLVIVISLVSILFFELLKRIALVRPLIGLKPMKNKSPSLQTQV